MAVKIKTTEKIADILTNHPKTIVSLILLITILSTFPLMNLTMETEMRDFSPDNEVVRANDTIDSDFPDQARRIFTIVEAENGNILSRECLLEMLEIERNIRANEDVQKYLINDQNNVMSIADIIDQALNFKFGTTLENASRSQLDEVIGQTLQIPELRAMVSNDLNISENGHEASIAIIVTQLNNTLLNTLPDDDVGLLAIMDTVSRTELEHTEVSHLAGFNVGMEDGMMDAMKLLLISILLVIIILYLSLRRIGDVLLSLIGIPITFIWMFGIGGAMGLKMTMLSFFGPILVLALGIAYAIHSLLRYKEEREKGAVPKDAINQSIIHIGVAIFLATATTAAAFFSNIISPIPAIRDFGLMLGIGIFSAFVIMGIFIPALRLLLDSKGDQKEKKMTKVNMKKGDKEHRFVPFILKITAKPSIVLVTVFLITIVSVAGALQVETSFSPTDFISEDSSSFYTIGLMQEYFPQSGTEKAAILVEGNITEPEVLQAMERTVDNMKDDEYVIIINATPMVTCIVPYLNEVMQDPTLREELKVNDENNDLLPDTREDVIIVYDHLYEEGIGNTTATDIRHVLHRTEGDYDKTVLYVDLQKTYGADTEKLMEEMKNDIKPLDQIQGIDSVPTGEEFIVHIISIAMINTMFSSIGICLVVCFIILLLVFRSFKFGIVTMIPVCLVTIWILGTMSALGYSFNLITIMISALTIGVGVDYSIHITHRYREERANGKRLKEAIEKTLSSTGTALMGATATTALGFSVLAFASFKMFVMFGILTALMVIYSFIAAVFILPVLLMFVDRKNKG